MLHFIIAGAQRSGTTFLHTLLDAHPEIELARPAWPEPKFFLRPLPAGLDALEEYHRQYFGHQPGASVRGEKSTSYIESEDAARRIAQVLPQARLIFLLRNPIARAISNYRFTAGHGLENLSIDEVLGSPATQDRAYDRGRISVSPFRYLDRGCYADYLAVYARHFPKEQIKLLLSEHLTASPAAYGELLRWLGVDPAQDEVWQRTGRQRASTGEHEPSAATRAFLREYFSSPNQRLAAEWNLDLGVWEKSN